MSKRTTVKDLQDLLAGVPGHYNLDISSPEMDADNPENIQGYVLEGDTSDGPGTYTLIINDGPV